MNTSNRTPDNVIPIRSTDPLDTYLATPMAAASMPEGGFSPTALQFDNAMNEIAIEPLLEAQAIVQTVSNLICRLGDDNIPEELRPSWRSLDVAARMIESAYLKLEYSTIMEHAEAKGDAASEA